MAVTVRHLYDYEERSQRFNYAQFLTKQVINVKNECCAVCFSQ